MPRPRDELTPGEWALLALLVEQPSHGFALARMMAPDGEVGRVWALRRPLVYRALETLGRLSLVRPMDTLPSHSGPQRTILQSTPEGEQALTAWLEQPVSHVRDARSLLMLKLLFLSRRAEDPGPLLRAQRDQFTAHAQSLEATAAAAEGFERALSLWRVQSTAAVIRFADAMLAERSSNQS